MSIYAGFEHIVRENEPLSTYTRLHLGGVAEYFAEPTTIEELVGLVKVFSAEDLPIRLIGDGSNVLIRGEGVPGLVLHLNAPVFASIEVDGTRIKTGGGARMSHFVSTAVREGLSGPEQLVGIPGTIGGALHTNTGAHGVDIGTWIVSADVVTRSGELIQREKDSLNFSYRQSSLNELVIVSATFEFEREPTEELTRRMQKLWIVRRAAQPITDRRAAYIFKDHGGEKANELIEAAGLKGTRVGEVEVSDTDPNVFVANPGATSDDVLRLMEIVKGQVSDRLSIDLEPAIQIW
ncbi:MAG: UDP-N-acetylmuramate dehydrogenase [Planctomycetota bacterium]